MYPVGRMLIVVGLLIAVVGILLLFVGRIPFLGRLPGDFVIQRRQFTFYFPIATCVVLSLLLTLVLYLFGRR
ncbi:MAG: DUF2905 domain-containing protein [Candidatus Oleimicrobiaceae bacterium]